MKTFLTLQAKFIFLLLSLFSLFIACTKNSDTPKRWVVTTLAGSGNAGFTDGDTTQAQFSNPEGITTDNKGNLFVGDVSNSSIRQITYSGQVTTYADYSIDSSNPILGTIYGIVRDSQGNLYIIDYGLIRKISSPTNSIIFAGNSSVNYKDSTGVNATFNIIGNMAIDKQDNIFLPDYDLHDVFHLRKVTSTGVVTTLTLHDSTGFSSNGTSGNHYFYAIAVDASGNIYVTGNGNNLIKKVDANGTVTVLAGAGNAGFEDGKGKTAQFNYITGMICDAAGNLWICDNHNHAIRKVTPDGSVTTIAGNGMPGYANGSGSAVLFKNPFGIAVDNTGNLYVTDLGNNRIRKLQYK